MNKQLLKRELQMCYSDQAEHFAYTRQKDWPELDYIKTYLSNIQSSHDMDYHIVELGCGAGRLYPEVASIWGKQLIYKGCDLAPGMIEHAKNMYSEKIPKKTVSKNHVQWIVSDMLTFLKNIPDRSVDCIVSIASLQHLMTQEQRQLVRMHSYRCLKYGGSMISVNRSYSDWFLSKYRKQQSISIGKSIIYPGTRSRNDIIIPRKDPNRQQNKQVWRRYYHIFTTYELTQLTTMSGFIPHTLSYILQDGSCSDIQWRNSRNTLLIAKKTITKK